MQRQDKSRVIKIIAALIIIGLIGYVIYVKTAKTTNTTPPAPPPPSVSAITVKPSDVPIDYEYAGRSAGSREVEIRARVSGILLKRTYVEGQPVKQGDILFRIDPEPFEAALANAQAKFVQAESNWKRVEELLKAKAVSGREYDEARAAYESAKAEAKTARINLGYTTVTAPISGVTSKEGMSEGSLVTADTSLLTKLSQLKPMYIYFAAPDSESLMQRSQVASGKMSLPPDGKLTAEIHFSDGTISPDKGSINFTDSIIDTQTGTVNARAVIDNESGSVLPGQFVRVVVKGFTKKNVITILDQAVLQGPQGTFVYIINAENKAKIAVVTLSEQVGTNRIVESGLKDGDKVITEGMIKVKPDSVVVVDTGKKMEDNVAPVTAKKDKE